ncbi:DUF5682 family protein [Streptomyces sp. NPDC086080]|uniref:DUF5682 family protein n=1 Tax=Streptomyces sp. NPDC086080 TaxID=3365748 RepID=UPI0037D6FA53
MSAPDETAALAARTRPRLIGVRHHSPALAVAVPRLLEAADAEVVCVELPADFQPWLPYLSDPRTVAPVALTGAHENGQLRFYPLADFSPELAAIRWARERGAEVICCDLPLADPGWTSGPAAGPAAGAATGAVSGAATGADGTGLDADALWDRAVEALAPGSTPEAVRRAALGFGLVLRQDLRARGGITDVDLAREAHMRQVVTAFGKRRVAAVTGAFHAPALTHEGERDVAVAPAAPVASVADGPGRAVVTSLVPYAAALLDSRSGYPAGVRDPRWQQAVLEAGGDPARIRDTAARLVTEICREIRASGHTAGTGEAIETLRFACDLGSLRGLPAPGRRELREAVTSVLGRGRPLDPVLEPVLVGTGRGRLAPGTPRSGLGPWVEAELAALRLPGPHSPDPREIRLSPLRSSLDARREILLQRLMACGVGYAEPAGVAAAREGSALTTRWQAAWTPSVAARLDLVGARGVTAAQAADGTLRENHRRACEADGTTPARVIGLLDAAARCALPALVGQGLTEAARILPTAATLPELLKALDLLESIRREHLPGTTRRTRDRATALSGTLLDAAVRALPGLAGSDETEDAVAVVTLAVRSGEDRLGLRLDGELYALSRTGSPLVQGASLAARVLLDLDSSDLLGSRLAAWVDSATAPDGRHRLERRLTGVLIAAGPLIESAPAALEPLLERVETMSDRHFLDRLTALRGGFRALTPEGRGRLLTAVTERLGDRPDLRLGAPAEQAGRWAEADHAGFALLSEWGLAEPENPAPTDQAGPSGVDPAGCPDRGPAGLPGADSAGCPDTDSAGRPERGPAGFPGANPAGLPGVGSAGCRDTDSAGCPGARLAGLSGVDSAGCPDTDSAGRPERGPTGFPGANPAGLPGVDSAGCPGARLAGLSGVDSAGCPDTDSAGRPDRGPAGFPGVDPAGPGHTGSVRSGVSVVADGPPHTAEAPASGTGGTEHGTPRLGPTDRWRLLLGRERTRLPPDLLPYARALDELFGPDGQAGDAVEDADADTDGGAGEGRAGTGAPGSDTDALTGGQDDPGYPSVRHWAEDLEALFGADIREEVLGRAAANGRTEVIAHLDPASVRPSVELLSAVLTLARGMPEQRIAHLRPLVARLVEELTRELATRLRPTLTGLSTPRPTRRPGGRLDLARTLRENLVHSRRLEDGRVEVIPERPVFTTRTARQNDWRLILVVDVSASMQAAVIWSALTAAVLGGTPMLSTHFLTFSTQVVDLTDRVDDPLSLLLEVKVGGGTHIAAGLAHARTLVKVPNRTLMVVVSDFEEGFGVDGLLAEVESLVGSGVQLLGCAALNDEGVPRYSVPVARQLVAAGMPVAALSPLSLARWVGERVRGATR